MKSILLTLSLAYSLFAGTYDYDYNGIKTFQDTKETDFFINGEFEEIIRFDALVVNKDNSKELKKIEKTIKEYLDNKKDIRVKIIGHTSKVTDDANEVRADSKTYVSNIVNYFSYSLDSNNSTKLSKKYAQQVKDDLVDTNITKELFVVEYRDAKDLSHTNFLSAGRDLSNRVMVTLYVVQFKDVDLDADNVADSKDSCLQTPKGFIVDERGCALDTDKDTIVDSLDKCSKTPTGLTVDTNGCPKRVILGLHFNNNSSKIKKKSFTIIQKYATFLEENPAYNVQIIGHTDNKGDEIANQKLSLSRAQTVKSAIVASGIDASRIEAIGKGEFEPIEDNRSEDGRKANRRIEAILTLDK